jgi:hypothetical protein
MQIEADLDAFRVGEITDDALDGFGEFPHQRRQGDDLVGRGAVRLAGEINDLDLMAVRQMLIAEALQIGECHQGFGGLTGHVQAEVPKSPGLGAVRGRLLDGSSFAVGHGSVGFNDYSELFPEMALRLWNKAFLSRFSWVLVASKLLA